MASDNGKRLQLLSAIGTCSQAASNMPSLLLQLYRLGRNRQDHLLLHLPDLVVVVLKPQSVVSRVGPVGRRRRDHLRLVKACGLRVEGQNHLVLCDFRSVWQDFVDCLDRKDVAPAKGGATSKATAKIPSNKRTHLLPPVCSSTSTSSTSHFGLSPGR